MFTTLRHLLRRYGHPLHHVTVTIAYVVMYVTVTFLKKLLAPFPLLFEFSIKRTLSYIIDTCQQCMFMS